MFAFILGCSYLISALITLFLIKEKFNILGFIYNQNNKKFEVPSYNLSDEKILVEDIDYYYSNTIARASKTMSECRYARTNLKKTGTEG